MHLHNEGPGQSAPARSRRSQGHLAVVPAGRQDWRARLNGAGKSTLLRIMAGEETNFIGEAFPAAGISMGFLQEPRLDPSKDVRGNVEEGVAQVRRC